MSDLVIMVTNKDTFSIEVAQIKCECMPFIWYFEGM